MMTMNDFVTAYAENIYKKLAEQETSIRNMSFDCCFCPLREKCHNDESGCDCADFIAKHMADVDNFRVR